MGYPQLAVLALTLPAVTPAPRTPQVNDPVRNIQKVFYDSWLLAVFRMLDLPARSFQLASFRPM